MTPRELPRILNPTAFLARFKTLASITELHTTTGSLINQARHDGPICITRWGRPYAVLVGPQEYADLTACRRTVEAVHAVAGLSTYDPTPEDPA